jgi:polysaccharide export outer membrane protein
MMTRPARFLGLLLLALLLLPLAGAAAAKGLYKIQPGDVLHVEVVEDPSLNRSVLVTPDGRVSLPLAGSVAAAGTTLEDVQGALAGKLAPNFTTPPSVFVSLERTAPPAATGPVALTTVSVYVLGEVNAPGKIEVTPGTTVLQLFAQAKGFTRFAAVRRIQLRRTDRHGAETIYKLNYAAIQAGTSRNGSTVLQEGDVIMVPQRRLFE